MSTSTSNKHLGGKVAIVTGAGSGIGRAHALLLAQEGAKVIVNDVGGSRDGSGQSHAAADVVVDEIKQAGGEAQANYDDISDRPGAEKLIGQATQAFGRLDIVINNAGILRDKTLLKMEDALWDRVIQVHLRGTYLCTQLAAKKMVEQAQGGRIINTTSLSGLLGNFGQSNYSAAKAGIYGLTRTAHMELFAKHRITVNAIAPVALTRMTEDLPMMQALPDAKDMLAPEHIARVALFLASDLAAQLSGQVVGIQGKQVFLYRMEQGPQTTCRGDFWSPEELSERWKEITAAG